MSEPNKVSRREFVGKTATAGAVGAAVPYFVPARALGQADAPGANDRIGVGLIGCGGMGRANLNACAGHPDVAVTAVCDVQKDRRDATVAQFKGTAKPYNDYRELLAQNDVDAVIIAPPPHWHALIAVDACEAGKDIYLQKPMTLYPAESLAVKRAVEKHGRISQIGTQIHAGANYRRVVEMVRSGNLGKISVARTFLVMNQAPGGLGHTPPSDPPPGVDWEMWIGPAPMRPYHAKLAASSGNHCSLWMDYSGGWTPGMAPHTVDLPYWALDLGFPLRTSCSGGRSIVTGDGDVPDVQEILWQFPDMTLTWMMSLVNAYSFDLQGKSNLGVYFHGVNGTLFANYGTHQVIPEGNRMKDLPVPEPSIPPSPGHEREWLNSIKTRQQPSCSVFYHYKIDVALTLGNLSLKLGRSIAFDPATEKITGDEEAARLAVPEYRDPWKFPAEYLES